MEGDWDDDDDGRRQQIVYVYMYACVCVCVYLANNKKQQQRGLLFDVDQSVVAVARSPVVVVVVLHVVELACLHKEIIGAIHRLVQCNPIYLVLSCCLLRIASADSLLACVRSLSQSQIDTFVVDN